MSLRNPVLMGAVFLCVMALYSSQALGTSDETAASPKEKLESALIEIFCETDLLQRMGPIHKHLKWLSAVKLTQEGTKSEYGRLDAMWGEVLPFLEGELKKRGVTLDDLRAIRLLTPEGGFHFSYSIAEKTIVACPKLNQAESEIMDAMLFFENQGWKKRERDAS